MDEKEDLQVLTNLMGTLKNKRLEYSGFDCILIYLKPDRLAQLLPDKYLLLSFGGVSDFTKMYFDLLKSNNLTLHFIKKILNISIDEGVEEVKRLASRILNQIKSDEEEMPASVRRPTYSALPGKIGVGVALVIDDRFWTDEW